LSVTTIHDVLIYRVFSDEPAAPNNRTKHKWILSF